MIKRVFILGFILSSILLSCYLLYKQESETVNQQSENIPPPRRIHQQHTNNDNNNQNQVSSNLNNSILELELQSLKKYIQLNTEQDQTIPFTVSVEAPNLGDVSEFLSNRKGIDLVCVIDNSGSMMGSKIENVKNTLKYIIEQLDERDRLSIITFNGYSRILQGLKYMSEENKQASNNIINSIYATGGTNISSGMKEAFTILESRQKQNSITSVFLLSDGQDNGSTISVEALLQTEHQNLQTQPFTIHTFGYGNDHDHILMSKISSLKDGHFYYVEKASQIDEFFANALGGLFSVAAQNIFIDLKFDNIDLYSSLGAKISKTYGTDWITIEEGNHYRVELNQLISGKSKDFVFEVTIPALSLSKQENLIQVNQLKKSFISASLSATPVSNFSSQINLNAGVIIELLTQQEEIPESLKETSVEVEYHYWRVKSSEVIYEAMKHNQAGDYQYSKKELKTVQEQMGSLAPETQERLRGVIKDVNESFDLSTPEKFDQGGQKRIYSSYMSNAHQVIQDVEDIELYSARLSNTIQASMVKDLQLKKRSQKEL